MSRARGVWWLLAAVLAVLSATTATTAPGAVGAVGTSAHSVASAATASSERPTAPAAFAGPRAPMAPAARTASAAAPDAEAAAVAYEGRGPACSPGAGDHGPAPAVPPRDGRDHACAPAVRLPAGPDTPGRALPAGVRVRGPDRPAPGPVELSVMRV
ncbi:hypothetical protein [Streptomyces sp. NPDC046161]|uniref:hypothetical protein n=1 Tax=Streptomyces sp. NPDC046161 TaxID=3155132 RepID=UPI0033C790E7